MFGITAIKVVFMMAYGVPGFLLVKTGALKAEAITAFAKFLLYVCQPALAIYSLNSVNCSPQLLANMGIFFVCVLLGQVAIIALFALVFRKKLSDSAYRVCAVAGACGNVGFIGIPLLEKLLPQFPEAVAFSATFSIAMNIIAWTFGLYMMTGNKKYISVRAVFANPATISFLAILPFFLLGIKLPELADEFITLLGRMATPVCMTVLGMRLATKKLGRVFTNIKVYTAGVSKLVIFPLLITLIMYFVPVSQEIKATAFILCCCPAAAMLLSLAEAYGGDHETAADVLLSTNALCMLTIPLMWTVYTAIFM